MRNTLVVLMLMIALMQSCVIHAQDSEAQNGTSSTSHAQEDSNFNVNLSLSDDLSTDEKFEIAKKAIRETVNGEFDKELELDGLSDDEKAEIVSTLERNFRFESNDNGIPASVLAIAIPAVVLSVGMPVIIVLLVLWFGHVKRKQKLELINSYIESDQEVPDQVLNAFDGNDAPNPLRDGIWLTGIGLGVFLAFAVGGNIQVAGFGLIPLFMGVARLSYWYIEERKAKLNV